MMIIIISNIHIYIYIIAQNLLYLFAGYFQHVSAPVSFPFPWSPFTNWKFLVRTVRILNGTLERVLWMCSIEIREPTCMQHRHGYKYIYMYDYMYVHPLTSMFIMFPDCLFIYMYHCKGIRVLVPLYLAWAALPCWWNSTDASDWYDTYFQHVYTFG